MNWVKILNFAFTCFHYLSLELSKLLKEQASQPLSWGSLGVEISYQHDSHNEAKILILLVQYYLEHLSDYPSRAEWRPTSSIHVPWQCACYGKASRESDQRIHAHKPFRYSGKHWLKYYSVNFIPNKDGKLTFYIFESQIQVECTANKPSTDYKFPTGTTTYTLPPNRN